MDHNDHNDHNEHESRENHEGTAPSAVRASRGRLLKGGYHAPVGRGGVHLSCTGPRADVEQFLARWVEAYDGTIWWAVLPGERATCTFTLDLSAEQAAALAWNWRRWRGLTTLRAPVLLAEHKRRFRLADLATFPEPVAVAPPARRRAHLHAVPLVDPVWYVLFDTKRGDAQALLRAASVPHLVYPTQGAVLVYAVFDRTLARNQRLTYYFTRCRHIPLRAAKGIPHEQEPEHIHLPESIQQLRAQSIQSIQSIQDHD